MDHPTQFHTRRAMEIIGPKQRIRRIVIADASDWVMARKVVVMKRLRGWGGGKEEQNL